MRTKTSNNQKKGGRFFSGYKPSLPYKGAIDQLVAIGSDRPPRLKDLLNTGAFDDLRDSSKPHNEQENLQALLDAWVEDNENCRVYRQYKSRGALKHDTNGYEIPAPPPSLTFQIIPSDERACLVLDKDNVVLAYKFRIPPDLHQKLVESNLFLSQAKRANYSLWAKTTEEICMSSDYRKHLPELENFFEHNRELWRVLDDVLRLLDPVIYKKYTNVDQFLKGDEKRLAGAWHGAIISRQTGSKEEAVPKKNWKDWGKGLTAMIPWGDYEGGDVKLYNLGMRFEIRPCDVLFYNARVASYGVQEVTSGTRNELDLVVLGTTIKWRHEKATKGVTKRMKKRKAREKEKKRLTNEKTRPGVGASQREKDNIRPATIGLPAPTRLQVTNSNALPLGNRRQVSAGSEIKNEKKSAANNDSANQDEEGAAAHAAQLDRAQKTNVYDDEMRWLEIEITERKEREKAVKEQRERELLKGWEDGSGTGSRLSRKIKRGRHIGRLKMEPKAEANIHAGGKRSNDIIKSAKALKQNSEEAAVLASVSTVGKTAIQIKQHRNATLMTHQQNAKLEKQNKKRANRTIAEAEHARAREKRGKRKRGDLEANRPDAEWATKKQNPRKKRKQKRREVKRIKAIYHQANDSESAKAEVSGPAIVKAEKVSMPNVKAELALPKKEAARENVGGEMVEVMCLD